MKPCLTPLLAASVLALAGVARGQAPASGPAAPDSARAADAVALAPPRAEATVLGPNPAYVGQLVKVEVALFRDNRAEMKAAPFFPEIRVPGAIAMLASAAPPPEVRDEDGTPMLVQRRHYLVFPQQDGDLSVPALSVAVSGVDGRPVQVMTKPVRLHADVPHGAGLRTPLVARNVEMERSIEGDLGTLRVGDAFTVRLRVTADETDAIMLPALDAAEIEGLARYPGQATSQTRQGRGSYRAERVDSVTYVANAWGRYTLPRVSVLWLDPQTGHYAEAQAPALSFRARVNPSLGAGFAGGPWALARGCGVLLGFLLAGWLGWRAVRRGRAARARRARVARTAGERAAFASLVKVAKAGSDGAVITALYRWVRFASLRSATLEALREAAHDPSLSDATGALEARISGHAVAGKVAGGGEPGALLAALRRFRRISKSEARGHGGLPRLNEPPSVS